MNEVITRIREINGGGAWDKGNQSSYTGDDGWEVVTDQQTITALISNAQDCCEDWGYACSVDDPQAFVGATLTGINFVDGEMNVLDAENPVTDDGDQFGDCDNTVFVNFETDRGPFQLSVYNRHNGYYGHHVSIKSNQLSAETGV